MGVKWFWSMLTIMCVMVVVYAHNFEGTAYSCATSE